MTDLETTLWESEKSFWMEGADFYESRLADGALMVLPYPVGLMRRDAAIDAIRQAPRWGGVELSDRAVTRRGATAVLSYRATGWRDGDGVPYRALCASTYVEDDDGTWLMLAHNQQALGEDVV
ncbi:nuclear transport factor 2 family protein [Wenxinia marina]|uniref:DUF4440 domain-containing protein n=1 Tax=Wenxinia marina DSM 24838 TaxID=1123501 RepID=A0A0D0QA74_9RHOB|nr:nuclear transport factor 2 family protein [Wenxinia marina]KIQ67908.1 hypothetical protein Wenmar_03639 [Wenxinia marina DSM 24838]GGL74181.1 hypothetical protein GCM10011392_30880 [Wenxinia marina]